MSHNPMGLHGLLQGWHYFFFTFYLQQLQLIVTVHTLNFILITNPSPYVFWFSDLSLTSSLLYSVWLIPANQLRVISWPGANRRQNTISYSTSVILHISNHGNWLQREQYLPNRCLATDIFVFLWLHTFDCQASCHNINSTARCHISEGSNVRNNGSENFIPHTFTACCSLFSLISSGGTKNMIKYLVFLDSYFIVILTCSPC
jgi:hypothetical protein